MRTRLCRWLWVAVLAIAGSAQAQWTTQTFELKPGWNAIYTHVDPSYATLSELIDTEASNPIDEVWMWKQPVSAAQFVESPQAPTSGGSQWLSWVRTLGPSSELQRLAGNNAYLVHVTGAAAFSWSVKGKPVPPAYEWTTTGLNFIGFPSAPATPPTFETFLSREPELQQSAEIYHYPGGSLGVGNPARLFALRTKPVSRGEAFWIRSGTHFNKFFAPFELTLQNRNGVLFGAKGGQYKLRVKNLTGAPLTVRLNLVDSDEAPSGQSPVAGPPSILVRGELNLTNITYGFTELSSGVHEWTLAAEGEVGSEKEIVLGVNRSAMSGNAGDEFAAILRLTDSLGFSQVELPVSATLPATAGLWVGSATVTDVRHYLKNYLRRLDGAVATDTNGQYVVESVRTDLGAVAKPYNLRLIVHQDADGKNTLLQRVYYGMGAASNIVAALNEDALHPAFLKFARRISAVHLPFTAGNVYWSFDGELRPGTNAVTEVTVGHGDQGSNPFLHTYHPDHDNLNATFDTPVDQGWESYTISRRISLAVLPPNPDFNALTASSDTLLGKYEEFIAIKGVEIPGVGPETRDFDVAGVFMLKQLSDVSSLTE